MISIGTGIEDNSVARFKRKYGPELVVNGGFDTDTVWQKNGATISGGTLNTDGTNTSPVRQLGILTIGHTYQIKITVVTFSAGDGYRVLPGGSANATPHMIAPGEYNYTRAATGINLEIDCRTGEIGSVDNVSIKRIL